MSRQAETNLRNALDFHNAVFNRYELEAIERYVSDDFIEHKPSIEDGRQSLIDYCTSLAATRPHRRNTIVRAVADDDYAVLHGRITDPDGGVERAAVDIFRMRGGMICEHWEVVQPIEAGVNPQPMI